MKKIYLLLIAIFIVINSYSQITGGGEVSPYAKQTTTTKVNHKNSYSDVFIGPKIGLNFSDISGLNESSSATGLNLGVVFEFYHKSNFSYQWEFLYTRKGFSYIGTDPLSGNVNQTCLFNYIEIPYLIRYNFGTDKIKGFVDFGAYFAFEMSQTVTDNTTGTSETYTDFGGEEDNRFDVGLAFGGGVKVFENPGAFVGELRYDLGLVSVSSNNSYTNGTFMISVGYVFKLGNKKTSN